MKKLELYVNVSPLDPKTMVKIAEGPNNAKDFRECKEHFEKLGYELLSQNYRVSLKQIEETTLKDWIPMND